MRRRVTQNPLWLDADPRAGAVEIDWSHPIAQDLAFFALPGQLIDIVSGAVGSRLSSTPWHAIDKGLAAHTTAGTQAVYFPFPQRYLRMQRAFTIIWWGAVSSLDSYGSTIAIPYASSHAPPYSGPGLSRFSFVTNGLVAYIDSTATSRTATSDAGYWGAPASYGQYGVTRSGAAVLFYRDGQQHGGSKTITDNDPTTHPNRRPIVVGTRNESDPGDGVIGDHHIAAFWTRALSALEIAQLYVSPYCVLRPKVSFDGVFVPPAPGGAPPPPLRMMGLMGVGRA